MKAAVFFLALSALIASSYSVPAAKRDKPAKKVIFTDGKKGPDDYILAAFSTIRKSTNETSKVETWNYGRPTAHISYVEILQVGPNTNATATITSGGVGSNHLTFIAVGKNKYGFHFEVIIWGFLKE